MNLTTVLITGAGGQLASDLRPLLEESADIGVVVACRREDLDITSEAAVTQQISEIRPQFVINLAAYNLVDQAEQEPDQAIRVNAEGPRHLAHACRDMDATLVHVSTDHVFGGDSERRTPYHEEDRPDPISVYGHSKLAGERAVQSAGCRHLIIRTCGLYGAMATRAKGNFVTTIRRLAGERDELKVVHDQVCTPSWTRDVAVGIVALIQARAEGIVNVTNSGEASWYDVACEIVRLAGLPTRVVPISSAEYGAAARRPAYSVLSTAKFVSLIRRTLPPWRTALKSFFSTY